MHLINLSMFITTQLHEKYTDMQIAEGEKEIQCVYDTMTKPDEFRNSLEYYCVNKFNNLMSMFKLAKNNYSLEMQSG